MSRLALASACTLCLTLISIAADPLPPVERHLELQAAMAVAKKSLASGMPDQAVTTLEKVLTHADGNTAFLNLLRESYLADLQALEKAPKTDPERREQTRRKLALLGGVPTRNPPVGAPPTQPGPAQQAAPEAVSPALVQAPTAVPAGKTTISAAVAEFKQGRFTEADRLFRTVGAAKLTQEQKTAWAYCRIKLAADRVNAPNCDPAAAAAAVESVSDAIELIADNAKLLGLGREVLRAARAKAGTAQPARPLPSEGSGSGEAVETANFRIRHGGNKELGEAVARAAEGAREQIFERWSGPPGGAWQPKCEIVIHTTAADYARVTGQPAARTGHATVRLESSRATERRIDLQADDDTLVSNALPRELTHVVLADLFATKPLPRWAVEGMAILASSPAEVGRYTRTLSRCTREGELRSLAVLFDFKEVPAEKTTGFYCQSVSVTEYLIKLSGERNFKIFLGDAQRHGVANALKRQYGLDGPVALEQAWKRATLEPFPGQTP